MLRSMIAAMAAMVFAGCATQTGAGDGVAAAPSPPPPKVRPASPEQVARCEYVDDITSVSSRYGIFAAAALEDTKAQVIERAAAAGATHIVWATPQLVYGSTTSSGKAYRCT